MQEILSRMAWPSPLFLTLCLLLASFMQVPAAPLSTPSPTPSPSAQNATSATPSAKFIIISATPSPDPTGLGLDVILPVAIGGVPFLGVITWAIKSLYKSWWAYRRRGLEAELEKRVRADRELHNNNMELGHRP